MHLFWSGRSFRCSRSGTCCDALGKNIKGGPIIALPANIDPDRLARLQAKLAEYRARSKREEKENHYLPPELWPDTEYRIAVLEAVLTRGGVATWDLCRELKKRLEILDAEAFDLACQIIADYITTGGEKVVAAKADTPL